jgi:uncharacterized glyoxalase superfamily protein PhnB
MSPKCPIIPVMRYQDATAAVAFLCEAFGFERRNVYEDGGQVVHAELAFGTGLIMLGPVAPTEFGKYMLQPGEAGGRVTQANYLIVSDPDAHCERARNAGATILMEPSTKDYGGRDYACRDPEGHVWSFGTYDPWAPPG